MGTVKPKHRNIDQSRKQTNTCSGKSGALRISSDTCHADGCFCKGVSGSISHSNLVDIETR